MSDLISEVARLRGEVCKKWTLSGFLIFFFFFFFFFQKLLLPPSVLLDKRTTSVYDAHFEQERRRRAGKAKSKARRLRKEHHNDLVEREDSEDAILSPKGVTEQRDAKSSPRPTVAAEQRVTKSPVASAVVAAPKPVLISTEKAELKELSSQLDANRRLSVNLKRSLVQQAVVNAATKRLEDDEETTSLDSADSEEKHTSLASATLPEDEIPKRNFGTDDSEVEMVDALADRRPSVSEISEQKEEILEVSKVVFLLVGFF
jgi:hypothetical protein